MLIEQPENAAKPLMTVLVSPLVHESVAPAGLAPIERKTTVELSPVATWFSEFSTATTGCCAHATPASPPPGSVVKARCWVDPTRKPPLIAGFQAGLLVALSV